MMGVNTLQTESTAELARRVSDFKEQGFTVFEKLYSDEQVQAWRDTFKRLQNENVDTGKPMSWWYGDMCERAPDVMLPAVANPMLLDFAETVMGPFVQLDNLTLAGFPSVTREEAGDRVTGWHRDRWGKVPTEGVYERPNAINAIAYLQDLTPEYGPLRVVPGSHRKSLTMQGEEGSRSRPDEIVLSLRAGDVVLIHNCLAHSGTPNTSGQTRYFFSVYYNLTWLRTTDNHSGQNIAKIVAEARRRNDLRTLRLFSVDDNLEARANSGFLQPDEARWAKWVAQDKAALLDEARDESQQ